jgi:hypothetical protein
MKTLVIYLDCEKTSWIRISPSEHFNNDWNGLANALTNGNYHSYNVIG